MGASSGLSERRKFMQPGQMKKLGESKDTTEEGRKQVLCVWLIVWCFPLRVRCLFTRPWLSPHSFWEAPGSERREMCPKILLYSVPTFLIEKQPTGPSRSQGLLSFGPFRHWLPLGSQFSGHSERTRLGAGRCWVFVAGGVLEAQGLRAHAQPRWAVPRATTPLCPCSTAPLPPCP